MNFLKYVCAYFNQKQNMATLQDLNDAISAATAQASATFSAAQDVLVAANAVAARAANIPGPIDYQAQVDAVGNIQGQLFSANGQIVEATNIINGVLP